MNARSFDNIETFVGGEENWQIWSWEVKTAVPGTHGVSADVMTASETGENMNTGTVLNDVEFVDVHKTQQRTVQRVRGRVHGSEGDNDSQRDGTGRRGSVEHTARQSQQVDSRENVPCATRIHVSKISEGRKSSEGGAKIPDLCSMSAMPDTCPKGVKDQMLMRLDEIGEHYENLKTDTSGPMDVDNVSGSGKDDEDWQHVDEIQRIMRWYKCGLMGRIAKDCRGKGTRKGKMKDGEKGYTKGKGKAGNGKKDGARSAATKEKLQEILQNHDRFRCGQQCVWPIHEKAAVRTNSKKEMNWQRQAEVSFGFKGDATLQFRACSRFS